MSEELAPFEFRVKAHVTFLQGYFDATGRVLTTDQELWTLTARDTEAIFEGEFVLGVAIRERSRIENWSREFGSLLDDFLGIDQRGRLGFYLIEYICWFKEFTRDAECLKLKCDSVSPGSLGQAVYLLQLKGGNPVLLLFQRLDKRHNERLQPIGREDAPSG